MLPEIVDAGVTVARKVGYLNITREAVAAELGQSANWLQYRCGLKPLVEHLRQNAETLGLTEGQPGDAPPGAKLSGAWAERNRDRLLAEAYDLAQSHGFMGFSRNKLAAIVGVAAGVINLRWGSMPALRDEVARLAIRKGNLDLLRQAQAVGNPVAIKYFKDLDAESKAG